MTPTWTTSITTLQQTQHALALTNNTA